MTGDRSRLARMAGLAEVWWRLYLYHPGLTVPDGRWESALEAAIRLVERAQSSDAFASAIGEALLTHLDDPWTSVSAPMRAPVGSSSSSDDSDGEPIESRVLPDGVGYVRCSCTAFDHPYYPTLMHRAVTAVRDTDRVVVDLRWGRSPRPWPNLHRRPRFSTDDCWPGIVLGFFVEGPVPTPPCQERVHTGWSEEAWSHYGETRRLRPGEPLQPVRRPPFFIEQRYSSVALGDLAIHPGPLAVIVDDHSIGWLDKGLLALQEAGLGVVVHETDGHPIHRSGPRSISGGVELRTRLYRPSPDRPPDRVLLRSVDRHDAVDTAVELLGSFAPDAASTPPPVADPLPRPAPGPAPIALSTREGRLAGLLKTWAVLGEFHPHPELADLDWREGLSEWIRRVDAVDDSRPYYRVLLELAARLNDSHCATPGVEHPVVDEILGTHTPPFRLSRVEDHVLVTEIHEPDLQDRLPLGARVTHVDGRSVEEIVEELGRIRSSSTRQALDHWLYDTGGVVSGSRDSRLTITIAGRSGPSDVAVRRTVENRYWLSSRRPTSERLDHRFGYIDLTRVRTPDEFDEVLGSLRDTDGLVLDVRGYPGFTVQTECVGRLIDRPVSSPRYEIPLRSVSDDRTWHVSTYEIHPHDSSPYRAPVVVLIDAGTVSSAEDFCLCLRDTGRVTFVGRPTAGTDGNITNLHLPDGGRFWFSGMRVVGVDGRRFQNVGVEPDVFVPRTPKGVAEGRDEILEAAVEALTGLADV